MKTSEFKREIEALGFYVETHKYDYMKIFTDCDYDNYFLAVGSLFIGDLEVENEYLGETEKYAKAVKLAVDYAFTPLKERKDEPKKYAIRLFSGDTGYLNYNKDTSLCIDTAGIESNWGPYQCFFTEQEYNRIRKNELQAGFTFLPKFDPDNTDVFVPVEEDE